MEKLAENKGYENILEDIAVVEVLTPPSEKIDSGKDYLSPRSMILL